MKFTWGTGIFIFIVLFFISAITFIVWTFSVDFNLVEKDYYPKGLQYDVVKNKMNNTNALAEKISADVEPSQIKIHFPSITKGKQLLGDIWVYRPSDEKKDLRIPVKTDTACCMFIPRSSLSIGKYTLKFDWKLDSTAYYQEIEVYLP